MVQIQGTEPLWAMCLAIKYCKNSYLGSQVLKNADSGVWKRIIKVSKEVNAQCFWKVGAGPSYFWEDEWSQYVPLSVAVPSVGRELDLVRDYGEETN